MEGLSSTIGDVLMVLLFWLVVLYHWRIRSGLAIPEVTPASALCRPGAPLVSIIVPARNEATQIEQCIRSLLAQDYPSFELLVVDDCSEDETAAVVARLAAAEPRLKLLRGRPLPPGWMGKAHALYQGYRHAKGSWLLFTDADTHHAPSLLSGVMSRVLLSSASFVTVLAHQVHPTPGVYVANLSVFTYILMVTDPRGFTDPRSRHSLVNGQYVMFSREAYEAIGTHAAVREYSSTDVSLGYLAKLDGWGALLLDGRQALRTTMYRTFHEVFHGWSRSLVNGIWTAVGPGRGSVTLLVLTAGLSLFWIGPWLGLLGSLITKTLDAGLVSLAQILAGLCLIRLFRATWRAAVRDAGLMPCAFVLFALMVITGLARAWINRGTVWKGRVVRTHRALPPWTPRALRVRKP